MDVIQLYTASVKEEISQILTYTSSLNSYTQSVKNEVATIQAYTASVKEEISQIVSYTSSLNSYTQSVKNEVANIQAYTQSLKYELGQVFTYTSSLNAYTQSVKNEVVNIQAYTASVKEEIGQIVSYTSSLNAYTQSVKNEVANIQIYTASVKYELGQVFAYTASVKEEIGQIVSYTASLNVFTASAKLDIVGLQSYSHSLKNVALVSGSQQVIDYNKFALTASANTFYGNQTITGSLKVSGSLFLNEGAILSTASLPILSQDHSYFGIGDVANYPSDLFLADASIFIAIRNNYPISNGPGAQIQVKSGSQVSAWYYDGDGTSYLPGDVNIGFDAPLSAYSTSGSLNIKNGNINLSGSLNVSGSSHTIQNGYIVLTQVSQSLNFADDASAASAGVPLGGLYRNGNFIAIRIS